MMPTTIDDIISQFKVHENRYVKWGQRIPTEEEGIYIVTVPESIFLNKFESLISKVVLSDWISQCNGFTIDKVTTNDISKITERLSQFWLPDENILYIGKAPKRNSKQGLGNRVKEFYCTPYGKRRPHAGGHWIKTLEIISDLNVHYFICDNSHQTEIELLEYFISRVSEASKRKLRDQQLMLPFANLELRKGQIKRHGLGNMKH